MTRALRAGECWRCSRPLHAGSDEWQDDLCTGCGVSPDQCECAPSPAGHSAAAALPDFDLGELAEAGIKPPELVAGRMLYLGGVHCLAGQPGGGKSTILCWWMLTHIRDGGSVLFMDEESGPELVAEKMLDLGATPAELRPPRFSYVPFPGRGWNDVDILQLRDRIEERKPGIIGWDSAAAFLSIAGKDENDAMDTTRFWQRVLVPCARTHGAAVVAVDHTGKGEHGGYGRGSGAKKAASDVMYIVETVEAFNRAQDGALRLTTAPGKDRRGYLPKRHEIRVKAGPPLSLEFTAADGEIPESGRRRGGKTGMPPAKAKLLEALTALSPEGEAVTIVQLVDWIAAVHHHGLARQTCSTYLNALADEGLAVAEQTQLYKPAIWRSAVPAASAEQLLITEAAS